MGKTFFLVLFLLTACHAYAQTSGYEKQVLFTLEWGDELHQIGQGTSYRGKTGPFDFVVTSNGIWIYDEPQSRLKCFSERGELLKSIELVRDGGDFRTLASDEENKIWFFDGELRKIWVYSETSELEKTIVFPMTEKVFTGV